MIRMRFICAALVMGVVLLMWPRAAVIAATTQHDPAVRLWLEAAWRDYKARFVMPDGRVVDDANGGISHSEGQGYGLLLASEMGDREAFQRIYQFTKRELMKRDDGLIAWRYDPNANPRITDMNNATDGDLLVAWGLLKGYELWRDDAYIADALTLADAIKPLMFNTEIGTLFLPGREGFHRSSERSVDVINPSYWVFPALESLASHDPAFDWEAVAIAGDRLLDRVAFGPEQLATDWVEIAGPKADDSSTTTGRLAFQPAAQFEPVFSYNAVRIPLYLAWSGNPQRVLRASSFADLYPFSDGTSSYEVNALSGERTERMGGAGFDAIAALAHCLHRRTAFPQSLTKIGGDHYYPTTLQLFVISIVSKRYPQCLALDS